MAAVGRSDQPGTGNPVCPVEFVFIVDWQTPGLSNYREKPMYDPDHYPDDLDRQKNPIEKLGLRPVVIGLLLFWGVLAWWFWW